MIVGVYSHIVYIQKDSASGDVAKPIQKFPFGHGIRNPGNIAGNIFESYRPFEETLHTIYVLSNQVQPAIIVSDGE